MRIFLMIVLGNGGVKEGMEELQLSVLLQKRKIPLLLDQEVEDDVILLVLLDIDVRTITHELKILGTNIMEEDVLELLLPILDHDHIRLSLEIIDADN
jgi:hypothetical protein